MGKLEKIDKVLEIGTQLGTAAVATLLTKKPADEKAKLIMTRMEAKGLKRTNRQIGNESKKIAKQMRKTVMAKLQKKLDKDEITTSEFMEGVSQLDAVLDEMKLK